MPENVWVAPEAELTAFRTAADEAAGLTVRPVRDLLWAPDGPHRWPRHRINETEIEWRRWRIRTSLGLAEPPPGSVRRFESLAVEAGVTPAAARPELAEVGVKARYEVMFPQGALIIPAVKQRVVRAPAADDELHAVALDESRTRRSRYLDMLDRENYWWTIPDLITPSDRKACLADVAVLLDQPRGESFSGGPTPGWDVEHDALVSDSRNAYIGAGPALIKIHEAPPLVDAISRQMGRRMWPTRCTYLNYRTGDYLGVHTDQPTCEVSLLFTVTGEPGPMRSYLDETAHDPDWLERWVGHHGNFPDGGLDFVYEPGEGLALTGRAVPHARLPQKDRAVIGALFYSGLI